MSEPDRERVDRTIKKGWNDNEVESYLSTVLSKVPEEPVHVQSFTDMREIFYSTGHILQAGRTGYGKTSLQLSLLRQFIESSWKVLYRDDGGCEFGYLAKYYPTQIFVPEGDDISLTLRGFTAKVVKTNDPKVIIEETYRNNYPFNVIVFDAYVIDPAVSAKFYCSLFKQLIHKCQQTPRSKKQPLIFAIDELNDLIAPHGRGITGTHESLLGLFETNVRKLRKHKVRLMATTHRFNQLSINVRSQCDHIIIRKSYGYDIWTFFAHALVTANNKTFWRALRKVISLPVNEFMFIDHNNNFDFYHIPDIPRDACVDVEPLGVVEDIEDEKDGKRITYSVYNRDIKISYLLAKGKQYTEIARQLNVTPNLVAQVKYKLVNTSLLDIA